MGTTEGGKETTDREHVPCQTANQGHANLDLPHLKRAKKEGRKDPARPQGRKGLAQDLKKREGPKGLPLVHQTVKPKSKKDNPGDHLAHQIPNVKGDPGQNPGKPKEQESLGQGLMIMQENHGDLSLLRPARKPGDPDRSLQKVEEGPDLQYPKSSEDRDQKIAEAEDPADRGLGPKRRKNLAGLPLNLLAGRIKSPREADVTVIQGTIDLHQKAKSRNLIAGVRRGQFEKAFLL